MGIGRVSPLASPPYLPRPVPVDATACSHTACGPCISAGIHSPGGSPDSVPAAQERDRASMAAGDPTPHAGCYSTPCGACGPQGRAPSGSPRCSSNGGTRAACSAALSAEQSSGHTVPPRPVLQASARRRCPAHPDDMATADHHRAAAPHLPDAAPRPAHSPERDAPTMFLHRLSTLPREADPTG